MRGLCPLRAVASDRVYQNGVGMRHIETNRKQKRQNNTKNLIWCGWPTSWELYAPTNPVLVSGSPTLVSQIDRGYLVGLRRIAVLTTQLFHTFCGGVGWELKAELKFQPNAPLRKDMANLAKNGTFWRFWPLLLIFLINPWFPPLPPKNPKKGLFGG